MEAFFQRFPEFVYDPSAKSFSEFNRLRVLRGWSFRSTKCKAMRKDFFEALQQQADTPLDDLFLTEYPSFDFNTKASPELEFQRLTRLRGWDETAEVYKEARRKFQDAYDQQFKSSVCRFFSRFPAFDFNPRAEVKSEFERLRDTKGWFGTTYVTHDELMRKAIYREYKAARKEFYEAFKRDFDNFFGEGHTAEDWIFLCDVLQVQKTPKTIKGCKSALKDYYVNIYDVYYHVHHGNPLKDHKNLKDLSDYSTNTGLIYPLGKAKITCMQFLLRKFSGDQFYDDWTRTMIPKTRTMIPRTRRRG